MKHGGKWVSYLRVSTDKQGATGLGIEAQRKAVLDFLNGGSWQLAAEFVEVESGKNSDRPQLACALATCKRLKARLVIARLDRLARNVHFISGLMERKIDFVACDMPNATPMMLHIYAAVAEQEAKNISERTRVALAAARGRGVKLGGPNLDRDRTKGHEQNRANAAKFAANVLPIVQQIRAAGVVSTRGIAKALNDRGVRTARGTTWHNSTVRDLLKRQTST